MGFNNNGVSTSQSCVDRISPPYDGYNYSLTPGSSYLPATYTWRHACSGVSASEGMAQELPNGNMIVCMSLSGYIYEVNSSGTTIWSKNAGGFVSSARRYSACYVNGTIPATPTITQNGESLTSSLATTYQWYYNSTIIPDATGQVYMPPQNGLYKVRVTNEYGCESDFSAAFNFINPWKYFDLKIMLEGAYTMFGMTTMLNSSGLLPLSQPYSASPWYYSGSEVVPSIPNSNITDWVLVELRQTSGGTSTATSSTIIARKAGFLLKNGNIVDLDGASQLRIYAEITQNLFVVIWHRNHLGIMSANPMIEVGGAYTLDFSINSGNAYFGTASQKQLAAGVWGMVAGDGNNDKLINVNDKTDIWSTNVGKKLYHPGDFNLDTEVDNPDKNDWWFINTSYQSYVPN